MGKGGHTFLLLRFYVRFFHVKKRGGLQEKKTVLIENVYLDVEILGALYLTYKI